MVVTFYCIQKVTSWSDPLFRIHVDLCYKSNGSNNSKSSWGIKGKGAVAGRREKRTEKNCT